jgi:transmembrane sensor
MAIHAQGVVIEDIGTRFDVQTTQNTVRVAIADGSVAVSGAVLSAPVALAQGQALEVDTATRDVRVRTLSIDEVGGWRNDRLSYSGEPLSLVVADIARYANLKIEIADAVAARRFSGTLMVDNGEAALRDFSRLMDLQLDRSADGYHLGLRH